MDSEEESSSEEAEVESGEESDPGVASLALATAYVAKSIFNTEGNDLHTNTEADELFLCDEDLEEDFEYFFFFFFLSSESYSLLFFFFFFFSFSHYGHYISECP